MNKNRKCNVCGENLPITDKFWPKNKQSREGYRSPCKKCYNEKKRDDRAKDPEKYRKRASEWCKNNQEKLKESRRKDYERHSDSYKSRSKKWRSNNLEKDAKNKAARWQKNKKEIKEYNKAYYLNNSENIKNNVAKWVKENPEKFKAIQARRRDKKNKLDCKITSYEIQTVYSLFNNKCFKCGSRDKLVIDHHIPLSKGRGLAIDNAVILCKSCNSKKYNKHPSEFYSLEELDMLNEIFICIKERCNKET